MLTLMKCCLKQRILSQISSNELELQVYTSIKENAIFLRHVSKFQHLSLVNSHINIFPFKRAFFSLIYIEIPTVHFVKQRF